MEILKDYSYSAETNAFLLIDRSTNLFLVDSEITQTKELKTNKSLSQDQLEENDDDEEIFWQEYVKYIILESNCGEGNRLCQRYEESTGNLIPFEERSGFFDQRLYKIFKKASNNTWFPWVKKSIQTIYGYDSSARNVLATRKKMLDTFIDACRHYKNVMPGNNEIHQIALILSYNIWQMDHDSCRVNKDPNSPLALTCEWETNEIRSFLFMFP